MPNLIGVIILCLLPGPVIAGEYEKNLRKFVAHVADNSATEDAAWLEMWNTLNEWEKVILVFGYVDDFSACQSVREFAVVQNPNREYRCIPVN